MSGSTSCGSSSRSHQTGFWHSASGHLLGPKRPCLESRIPSALGSLRSLLSQHFLSCPDWQPQFSHCSLFFHMDFYSPSPQLCLGLLESLKGAAFLSMASAVTSPGNLTIFTFSLISPSGRPAFFFLLLSCIQRYDTPKS